MVRARLTRGVCMLKTDCMVMGEVAERPMEMKRRREKAWRWYWWRAWKLPHDGVILERRRW